MAAKGQEVTVPRPSKNSYKFDRRPIRPQAGNGLAALPDRRAAPQERAGRLRGEGGAALVEFALILPLAILILFGLIDFGFIFQSYSQLRNGVQAGARLASTNNSNYAGVTNCSPSDRSPATNTTNLVCMIVADISPPLTGMSSGTLAVGIAHKSPTTANTTGQLDIVVCAAGTLNSTSGFLAKMLFGSQMGSSSTILAGTAPLNFSDFNTNSTTIAYNNGNVLIRGMNC